LPERMLSSSRCLQPNRQITIEQIKSDSSPRQHKTLRRREHQTGRVHSRQP
jgi:hypothetical protein